MGRQIAVHGGHARRPAAAAAALLDCKVEVGGEGDPNVRPSVPASLVGHVGVPVDGH